MVERRPQVPQGFLGVAGERVVGELVVETGGVGMVLAPLVEDLDPAVVLAGDVVRLGRVPGLVGSGREGGAGLAADDEDGRARLGRRRMALLADVGFDHRAGRDVEDLVFDREPGRAG